MKSARVGQKQPLGREKPSPRETSLSVYWTAIGLGFFARLLVASFSIGSNDAAAFLGFANHVYYRGLFTAYQEDPDLNHPPLAAYFSAGVLWFCHATGLDAISWFFFLFKLPGIAADGLAAYLLYRIWKKRADTSSGLSAAAVYALGLATLLISGYHGNTDTIYATLSLLSVYLMQDKRRPLLSGLALAGAINIKLIPCLLIPLLLLSLRRPRDIAKFLGGLAIGAIPFLAPLIYIGPLFYHNALSYTPGANRWGILLPFLWWRPVSDWLKPEEGFAYYYNWYGRYLVFALVIGWSVVFAWLRRWDRYQGAAFIYAIFLVFAPGFGVQYTALVAPLILATPQGKRGLAILYYCSAGLMVLCAYWVNWDGAYPFGSDFRNYLPHEVAIIGAVAWATLVVFLVKTLRAPPSPEDELNSLPLVATAAQSAPITR